MTTYPKKLIYTPNAFEFRNGLKVSKVKEIEQLDGKK